MKEKIKWFILAQIIKSLIRQGPNQINNIVTYYSLLRKRFEEYYTEDNKPTVDLFLVECHDLANGIQTKIIQ